MKNYTSVLLYFFNLLNGCVWTSESKMKQTQIAVSVCQKINKCACVCKMLREHVILPVNTHLISYHYFDYSLVTCPSASRASTPEHPQLQVYI